MRLCHLALSNFRNYGRQELDLPPGISLFVGDNASGKTALLEAIHCLATTRSHRALNDREMMSWWAGEDGILPAVSRLVGFAEREVRGDVAVEVAIVREGERAVAEPSAVRKRLKVNDVSRRSIDVIGQITVVIFSPEDLELIDGSPQLRRRYLDITLCQVDPHYYRALQQYNKVVVQRNSLLRRMKEEGRSLHSPSAKEELAFWNEEMARFGAYVLFARRRAVAAMNAVLPDLCQQLTGGCAALQMLYRSSFELDVPGTGAEEAQVKVIHDRFLTQLGRGQMRELRYGASLLGPHRDDLQFLLDDTDVSVYGSRGQQRAVVLSLKLAELEFIERETGEMPILLLDDVMSELDQARRSFLQERIRSQRQQVIVTATDLVSFAPATLAQAALYRVENGSIAAMSGRVGAETAE